MADVATFDFHVTSECSQECAYCWGPQGIPEVATDTALAIISKIANEGSRRIVFTGGDPMHRADLGSLIQHAADQGLEIALSTTGEKLDDGFLETGADSIDLISLPPSSAPTGRSSRWRIWVRCCAEPSSTLPSTAAMPRDGADLAIEADSVRPLAMRGFSDARARD